MSTQWAELLEQAILGKIVTTLIDEGFRVELSDQDGGGLFLYAAPDGGRIPNNERKYYVRLTPGNSTDLITDYSVNLEKTLKPVFDFCNKWQD